ncbi:hypothetical protein D3C87_1622700 [compost metagenome]
MLPSVCRRCRRLTGAFPHDHAVHPVGQNADATSLDLEGGPRIVFAVLPLITHGAAFDQHAHAFLVQRAPVFSLAVPELNRRPIAASIFIAALAWHGVVEVHIQP